jgi:5''-nucleotidase/2'',3''-cyclic phosphodiesterase and related esterases
MKRKLLALVLVLTLLLSCSAAAFAEGAERTGDIVILFTSDVHCGVDKGFGLAGLQGARDYFTSIGDHVLLVDDGDNIQGEPLGTMSRGELSIELMNEMGYDVAIPGNHDFDYGMDRFLELTKEAKFPYICCNFMHEGKPVFDPWVIKEADGVKLGFVGVTTPKTLTTSTPTYFQDENGEYVYGFLQDETGEGVYQAVQSAVDGARAEGADYVILMAHLGLEENCHPWTYADVISHTSGIDVVLDGHSHDTEQVVMKNKDGVDVPRSAVGTKLNCIGWCKIAKDGKLTVDIYTWNNDIAAPQLLGVTNEMSAAVDKAKSELSAELTKVVAHSDVMLTINDPEATDEKGKPIRMVRRAETNLGDLCADAYRDQSGADVAFVNGGGVRANIPAGDITLNDILSVHPFGNALCEIEVTGQQILDALEWGVRNEPGESGGFLQVSGLTYEIHSYIESGCKSDINGFFDGVEGERRVKNVKIDGADIDPDKTYTLASHNFMLLEGGDGFNMFKGAKLLQDRVKLDNQVLIDYITETLSGNIGPEYENLTGDGRIVIVEEKP